MRHRWGGRKLGRKTAHRVRMLRNMVRSLFTYGRIVTTLMKAKEARSEAEKLVTLAKRGGVQNLRRIVSYVGDRQVGTKIAGDVLKRFEDRKGGYTRIIKMGGSRWDGEGRGQFAWNRLGDNSQRVFLELVVRKEREEEMQLAGRGFQARQAIDEKRSAKKAPAATGEKKKSAKAGAK